MEPPLPDIVVDTELRQTSLTSKHTLHTYYVADPRPREVEEVWRRDGELGRSVATVWLETCIAGEESMGKCRAVKEVQHPSTKFSTSDVARELEAIGRLSQKTYRHRFVRSFGWFTMKQSVFIVMEYLPLGDLSRYLKQPIPETEAQDITRQLAEGLVFMHTLGFAHRDLKPKNILVQVPSPNWYVKIADFGISKRIQDSTTHTAGIGTVSYMAPEAVKGRITESFVYAVDMWAIGVISWQIITTNVLFPTISDIISFAGASNLPALSMQAVSANYTDFLEKCLTISASERLTSRAALEHAWFPARQNIAPGLSINFTETKTTEKVPSAEKWDDTSEGYATWSTRIEDMTGYSLQQPNQESGTQTAVTERTEQTQPLRETQESKRPQEQNSQKRYFEKQNLQEEYDTETKPSAVGQGGQQDSIEKLYQPDRPTISGIPLHYAATEGDIPKIEALLKLHVDVNMRDEDEQTPLHRAAWRGHWKAVETLLKAHAEVDALDSYDQTPLHYAARGGYTRTMLLLLHEKANVMAEDNSGLTPLHLVVQAGWPRTVEPLVEWGAQVDARDDSNRTALHIAASNGHVAPIDALILAGADLNPRDKENNYWPLHYAIVSDHVDVVRILINAGARLTGSKSWWPLECAVRGENTEIVQMLLDAGVSPDDTRQSGSAKKVYPSLCMAAFRGNMTLVKLLLDAGANPNIYTSALVSPLDSALNRGHADVLKLLLDVGAEPIARGNTGLPPLFVAIKRGYVDCVRHLITAGADITFRAENVPGDGKPLDLAVSLGNDEIIGMLLLARVKFRVDAGRRVGYPLHLPPPSNNTPSVRLTGQQSKNAAGSGYHLRNSLPSESTRASGKPAGGDRATRPVSRLPRATTASRTVDDDGDKRQPGAQKMVRKLRDFIW